MFNFLSRKVKNSSSSIANALLEEFILNKDLHKFNFEINENILPNFENKVVVYLKALTLLTLINKEKNKSKFRKVRENFELLIFPDSQEKESQNFKSIKSAMLHLNELLFNKERKEFSWAISWLNEIGIPETNPVHVATFSMFWMQSYVAVLDLLDKFSPY
jgi:hypothetical protein